MSKNTNGYHQQVGKFRIKIREEDYQSRGSKSTYLIGKGRLKTSKIASCIIGNVVRCILRSRNGTQEIVSKRYSDSLPSECPTEPTVTATTDDLYYNYDPDKTIEVYIANKWEVIITNKENDESIHLENPSYREIYMEARNLN